MKILDLKCYFLCETVNFDLKVLSCHTEKVKNNVQETILKPQLSRRKENGWCLVKSFMARKK